MMQRDAGNEESEPMSVSLRCSLCAALLGLAASVWVPAGATGAPAVVTYPSSQSIAASGPLPSGGRRELVYHTAIGERDGALLVVRNAKKIAVAVPQPKIGE